MRGIFIVKNIIKTVCVIIGTIIGAGFASGKEIYVFFNQYGQKGLWGIFIASILTGVIIYRVLMQMRTIEAKNYNHYLEKIQMKPKIKEVLNCIINIFLLVSFYIMIAGFCAYFKQEFGIATIIVGIVVCLLCYITFMNHIEGVTKINTILIPFLILMILVIGIKSNVFGEVKQIRGTMLEIKSNWLLASLEYASYNSILLIPILIGLKKYTYQKEKKVSIIVSGIFFLLATILYFILNKGEANLNSIELPLIHIVKQYGIIYQHIYGIVIISAIYTSAIAAGYGFAENCSKNKKTYKSICMLICITAIPVSKIGFSYLVNALYRVFGVLGLAQIIYILFIKLRLH